MYLFARKVCQYYEFVELATIDISQRYHKNVGKKKLQILYLSLPMTAFLVDALYFFILLIRV